MLSYSKQSLAWLAVTHARPAAPRPSSILSVAFCPTSGVPRSVSF
jgi:hypothetical protein